LAAAGPWRDDLGDSNLTLYSAEGRPRSVCPFSRALSLQSCSFIIVTTFDAPQYVEVAIEMGASGFLLKTAPIEEIVSVVRRVAKGGRVFASDTSHLRRGKRWHPLLERERDVVAGVLAGRSNDEIGGDLGVSTKTVEWHLSRLFERFVRDAGRPRASYAQVAAGQSWRRNTTCPKN